MKRCSLVSSDLLRLGEGLRKKETKRNFKPFLGGYSMFLSWVKGLAVAFSVALGEKDVEYVSSLGAKKSKE